MMRDHSTMRIVLTLVVGLALSATSHAAGELPTYTVAKKKTPETIALEGTVEAIHQATVSAQTAGEIIAINFDVNDFVAKDQVLLRFRDRKTVAGLSQTKAGLDEAEARLKQARSEHDRVKQLFDKQMATAARMDQAKADMQAAESRLNSAKAAVSGAGEQLSDTIIRAPYAGFVLKRFVELGSTALVGQPLFSGISLDELRVRVAVPQYLSTRLRQPGTKVAVTMPDGTSHQTSDYTLFPYADENTHTVTARITLPPKATGIYPGMLVRTAFAVGEKERLLVPEQSVVQRSEITGVYVMEQNNSARLRHIMTGKTFDDHQVEVLAGLSVGEKVILDPIKAGQMATASATAGSGGHP